MNNNDSGNTVGALLGDKPFGNVLIVGLGMIGGSFAKALKERGLATLYGADRREGELALGVSTGVIDYPAELTEQCIANMDVIVLATPVRAMESVLLEIKPYLKASTLLTDVGSTKGSVVEAAKKVFGEVPANFIPSHPIAGAEKSGVLAANSQLFEKHMAIVTPLFDSDPSLLDRLHQLWAALGSDVVSMDVKHHDHVLASSSHLPHLLAYTLVDALANSERSQDVFKFAAGGFRDFTRIASSDPVMWRDVFLSNKEATLATLDLFTDRLAVMRAAIEQGDGAGMFGVFTRAKSARDHFLRLLEQRTAGQSKEVKPLSMTVSPASAIKGEIFLSGDKSLSHKAITLACLSSGVSHLSNIDLTGDVRITMQAFRDMGVVIEEISADQLRVHGVGLKGLKAPIAPINVHQSSAALHQLMPVLAGQDFPVTLVGEGELLSQPMKELFDLVRAMGGHVMTAAADCLPVSLAPSVPQTVSLVLKNGSKRLHGAALLAMLYSPEAGELRACKYGIAQTKALFAYFGLQVTLDEGVVRLDSAVPQGAQIKLPGDVTQTAWLALSAALTPGSRLAIENALVGDMASPYVPFLKKIGANVRLLGDHSTGFDQGRLEVAFAPLVGFDLSATEVYGLRNELALVCVAAAYASGVSVIRGLSDLPYYYEDRVLCLVDALTHFGIVCEYSAGQLTITGGIPLGGELDCAGDYRLALAMLALGLRSREMTRVNDCQALLEEFTELGSVAAQLGFHCAVVQ
ncbi:prephenate dehydrogenase/arogenate dehydrogenase family protein [Marinomonas pollencensis]|uniref:prephenate dehydrogenase n=1 Tax=Marinomonas pollencensis TaxID=491954 RepID=A0A3E0DPU0_9GAMM|nr:prephenate dehydrogenase/arogenate dehydrogenase family protein [Marinomonas pollencensis]REG84205.1 3-phosphoshikimate 1-carboxyvinyltransferase [Marinomonas pollencensis]